MREVRDGRLWIGNALELRDYRVLHELGIQAIVDLALEEQAAAAPREFISLRYPLHDGAGNSPDMLRMIVHAIVQLLECKVPTMVACSAGMSRSPAIVATALSVWEKGDPPEYFAQLARDRPLDVSPLLWRDLLAAIRHPM